jgi:hypothetical protein
MRATQLIAVSSVICSTVAKRGGGGGGSSWGDYGGSSGSGGGGDNGNDGGGSYTPPPPPPPCDQGTCVCAMIDGRMDLYELPGLYYNGTITVSHKLTQNSAWDAERLHPNGGQMCKPTNDDAVKTYEYPALFYIGPQGMDTKLRQTRPPSLLATSTASLGASPARLLGQISHYRFFSKCGIHRVLFLGNDNMCP